eukprot:scaffold1638_cov258-Pinguiococcus_pyrenoidosus.AAC.6
MKFRFAPLRRRSRSTEVGGAPKKHTMSETAGTPDVDAGAVLAPAEEQLGTPVPAGAHVVGQVRSEDALLVGVEEAAGPKITDLQYGCRQARLQGRRQKDVLGLHVPMDDAAGVEMRDSPEHLQEERLDELEAEARRAAALRLGGFDGLHHGVGHHLEGDVLQRADLRVDDG